MPGEQIALIDMDGTIADYDRGMAEMMVNLASPGEIETIWSLLGLGHAEQPEWMENRRRLISMQPGFWRNLPPIPQGLQIVHMLLELGFECHVLTKGPSTKPLAWAEKLEWCQMHLPSEVKVTITSDKGIAYGKVLVDDYPPFATRWLEHRPRGAVLCPARPYNIELVGHPQVCRYDENTDIRAVLSLIRDREHGGALPDISNAR